MFKSVTEIQNDTEQISKTKPNQTKPQTLPPMVEFITIQSVFLAIDCVLFGFILYCVYVSFLLSRVARNLVLIRLTNSHYV